MDLPPSSESSIHFPFLTTIDVEDHAVVRIRVRHATEMTEWLLDISDPQQFRTFHPDVETAEQTVKFLREALLRLNGTSTALQPHNDGLLFKVSRQTNFGTKEASVVLKVLPLSKNQKRDRQIEAIRNDLSKVVVDNYQGEFCFKEHHDTLVLSHNNTCVRKKGTGETGPFAAAYSPRGYNGEIVHWEFKVVNGTRSVIMIGACPTEDLTTNAGGAQGVSLYLMNGHIYNSAGTSDYGLHPKRVPANNYIGMILDTKAYTIKFSINGEFGNAHPLPGPHGNGYFVSVSLYDGEECIEVLPHFCKHLG